VLIWQEAGAMYNKWAHFTNILTQLDLNANGSGKETITNITTFSSTITSEKDLSWKTQGDAELILQPEGQSEEKYNFTLDEENNMLTLTESTTGFTTEFFKNE
jgi:predicted RNase H-like nuclease (RuvC/YqgF family)